MPNERISMSKLKELIGLQSSNLSDRALGRALGLSVWAVSKYLRAVRGCGIGAAEAETPRSWNLNGACSGRFWGQNRDLWCPQTAPGSTASSSATGT